MSRASQIFGLLGAPLLEYYHSTTVIATPKGGAPTPRTAMVGPVATELDGEGRRRRVRTLSIAASQLAEVPLDMSFTVDGEVWTVDQILAAGGAMTSVRLTSVGSVEQTRPGYRSRL